MNFRKNRGDLPQFQMTAMMDVVFLLLCFFVASSVFSQWEYEVDLTLPTAKTGKMPDRLPGEVIINLSADGAVTVNQQTLTESELQTLLERVVKYFPGQPVILRCDESVSYKQLMQVIDACRAADVWNFSFATREAGAAGTEKAE